MRTHCLSLFMVVAAVCAALPAQKLKLAAPFSDHMVLQRERAVPIWGWATPVAEVKVEFAGHSVVARSGTDGRWRGVLPAMPAGGPFEMVVTCAETVKISDVWVGEVWLGSGQSNMKWRVKQSKDFAKEKAAAKYPKLRMFTVRQRATNKPQADCKGQWVVCSPATVGEFSATGYFFGRRLLRDLDVPVGIINSSWGGTAIEAWTRLPVQQEVSGLAPVLKPWVARRKAFDSGAAEKRHKVQLAKWRKRAEAARASKKRVPRRPGAPRDPRKDQNAPANLWNGMIAPIVGYGIRGTIWYQGERNARTLATSHRYRVQLPLMIADWRAQWGYEFPFGVVQLPNFKARSNKPGHLTAWAMMRESMLRVLSVAKTGLAVAIDIGEAKNIHPKNKQEVGKRLALWALEEVYGKSLEGSGPMLASADLTGGKVVLHFRHGKGLSTRGGGPLKGFAISGADHKWVWADAKIVGETVELSHADIAAPVAVRYAFGDNPECNLINAAGLPASPFRTDDWKGMRK